MKPTPPAVKVIPERAYDTASFRVKRYWHRHPERSFYLMVALIKASERPPENKWPEYRSKGKTVRTASGKWEFKISSIKPMFRKPPQPYRLGCPMCGGKRYKLGWHKDWDGSGESDKGWWHVSCGTAYSLMTTPNDFVDYFKKKQNGLCGISGEKFIAGEKIDMDHTIPLYRVFRDYGHLPIEKIMQFWGPRNLRAVKNSQHKIKNKYEAKERSTFSSTFVS